LEIIRQKGWQGLTWASYILYGNPTLQLLAVRVHDIVDGFFMEARPTTSWTVT